MATPGNGYSIRLGYLAGQNSQDSNAIAIGNTAGQNTQGTDTIAIGRAAGVNAQAANSIVLNASGTTVDAASSGLFISPLAADTSFSTLQMVYDPVSK